jgi:hypothetical protein
MCRPCLNTAHVYKDDVILNLEVRYLRLVLSPLAEKRPAVPILLIIIIIFLSFFTICQFIDIYTGKYKAFVCCAQCWHCLYGLQFNTHNNTDRPELTDLSHAGTQARAHGFESCGYPGPSSRL